MAREITTNTFLVFEAWASVALIYLAVSSLLAGAAAGLRAAPAEAVLMELGQLLAEIGNARGALSAGIGLTILLAAGGLSIGLVLGAVLAVVGVYGPGSTRAAVGAYVFVVRGVPLLVTLLFVFFGLGRVWRALPAEAAAILAMGLFSGAYIAEILRGALQSITRAQLDAARAIGLPVPVAPAPRRAAAGPAARHSLAHQHRRRHGQGDDTGRGPRRQRPAAGGQQIAMRSLLIPEFYLGMWASYVAINLAITAIGRRWEARFHHVAF